MKQLFLLFILVLLAYSLNSKGTSIEKNELPKNLNWVTNESDPEWSSPQALRGGVYHSFMLDFPLTFRYVGPESNSTFREYINDNRMGLVDFHPNTGRAIPQLATHWAYGDDFKTVYYKIDPNAKWSDLKPVTVDDFIFSLELYRSPYIMAPWYNEYYGEEYEKIIKYDDHTLAIVGKNKRPKNHLHYYYNLKPAPKHYYNGTIDKEFIKKYNFAIVPTTGAYVISDVVKGKKIVFSRLKNWWADQRRYYRNRYNVDSVEYSVYKDINVAYQYFLKKKIDSFDITSPDFWHIKTNLQDEFYQRGLIHKIWFYVETPQPDIGLWINQESPILSDRNVRYALAHSLNVDKVLSTLLRGDYERADSMGIGTGDYLNPNLRPRAFNPQMATQLLEKSHWAKVGKDGIRINEKGERLSMTITYGTAHHQDRLIILQEEAKKAGIEINLRLLDPNAAFKSMLSKQHEICYTSWTPYLYPQYRDQYHSSLANKTQNNNFSNMNDKELDQLIELYEQEFNESKKQQLAWSIQEKIYQSGVYIPLWLVPYYREAYWRWWNFPTVPATKSSTSLFTPFGTGGTFWLNQNQQLESIEAIKNRGKFDPVVLIDETYRDLKNKRLKK